MFAAIIFFISLACIAGLFVLKHAEMRTGRTLMPQVRGTLDVRAGQLKELLVAARIDLAKVPPQAVRITRILIHEAALELAAFARAAERQAYRLADLVSHKHHFERRETRSEFLKKVAEHKNGGSESESGGAGPELNERSE